jgi:hypothetical protein
MGRQFRLFFPFFTYTKIMIYLLFAFINALPGNDWVRATKGEINKQVVPFIANPQEFPSLNRITEALPNLFHPAKEVASNIGIADADILNPTSKIKLPDKAPSVFTSIDLAIPFPGISRWNKPKRPFELEEVPIGNADSRLDYIKSESIVSHSATPLKSSYDTAFISILKPIEAAIQAKEIQTGDLAVPNSFKPTLIRDRKILDHFSPSVMSNDGDAHSFSSVPQVKTASEHYPEWVVSSIDKEVYDRKKKEGLDVTLPETIKLIYKEANDIELKLERDSSGMKSFPLGKGIMSDNPLYVPMLNADKSGTFQYRFPHMMAKGAAHGTLTSRMYPTWALTPSQKVFIDKRQYEGWDLSLPEVIDHIKMEVNELDRRMKNAQYLNLPRANTPTSFLATGRAYGVGKWRQYPEWAYSHTRKSLLDMKQEEGWDVSLPEVINYMKEKADNYANYKKKLNRNWRRKAIPYK